MNTKSVCNEIIIYVNENLDLKLYQQREEKKILIFIRPFREPSESIRHVSYNIVLVIDVSESMDSEALVPDKKRDGYTILDLTKHVVRVTLKDLDDNDRFSLVIFFDCVKIKQKLIYMTRNDKKKALKHIDELYVDGSTNL